MLYKGLTDVVFGGLPSGSTGPFVVGTVAAAGAGLIAIESSSATFAGTTTRCSSSTALPRRRDPDHHRHRRPQRNVLM